MSMTWALYNFRDGSHFIKNYIALDFLSSPHFFEGVVFHQECLKGDDLTMRHLALEFRPSFNCHTGMRKITVLLKSRSVSILGKPRGCCLYSPCTFCVSLGDVYLDQTSPHLQCRLMIHISIDGFLFYLSL